ncbi:MAG: MaoC/PaaZ C-terminal domain-containing protein [Variovorax sp.]
MAETHSRFYEEFEVGTRYPTTSRLITLEDHLAFCELVRYKVPLFLDAEVGNESPYKSIICPSHLIMSFSTAMTGALFSESVLALLAIENVQFLSPVRPGDTIATDVEVIDKRLSTDTSRGVVTFRDRVRNQHNVLVFQNDKIALIKRQPVRTPEMGRHQ